MKYLIIAKRHPDELMSKSTNVRLSFYIFIQKMQKHEVYKPAKKLCYCHLGSSKIPFLLQKFNFLLASCIIGYIFASQFATYAILIFFPSLLFFFQHIPFLNLIHSKELTLTSSLTRPLLGDNRVLCAIFNFPLIFYLPIPTLINMHIRVGFDPQLDTSYLMTTVLSCNSSFLSLKLIAESKRAGIDHQLDAS